MAHLPDFQPPPTSKRLLPTQHMALLDCPAKYISCEEERVPAEGVELSLSVSDCVPLREVAWRKKTCPKAVARVLRLGIPVLIQSTSGKVIPFDLP